MASILPRRIRATQYGMLFVIGGILVAPIIAYISTFGISPTANHARWSEMGSAMSGIYTPILSLLTLIVLIVQVRLQNQINTHEFDRTYIAEARSDIQYFLEQINQELSNEINDGTTIKESLHLGFAFSDVSDLRSEQLLKMAHELNRRFPRIYGVWTAICPLLMGLKANDHFPYTHNFEAAKQKFIALLSYETCVALDQYVWCVSEGKLDFSFEFSPTLISAKKEC